MIGLEATPHPTIEKKRQALGQVTCRAYLPVNFVPNFCIHCCIHVSRHSRPHRPPMMAQTGQPPTNRKVEPEETREKPPSRSEKSLNTSVVFEDIVRVPALLQLSQPLELIGPIPLLQSLVSLAVVDVDCQVIIS